MMRALLEALLWFDLSISAACDEKLISSNFYHITVAWMEASGADIINITKSVNRGYSIVKLKFASKLNKERLAFYLR